jgi:rod shape-determining protein MreD
VTLARITALAVVLVIAALLETTVFAALAVGGHTPSLVTLTVVAVALTDGSESGGIYGFVAGLLVDLLGGGLVGLYALVLLLIGFGVGGMRVFLAAPPFAVHLVVGGLAAAASSLLYGLLLYLLDPADLTLAALAEGAAITALYSAALAPFVVRAAVALISRTEPAPTSR